MFGTAVEGFQGLFRRGTEIIVVRIALSKVFKRISINTFALDFPNENGSATCFTFFLAMGQRCPIWPFSHSTSDVNRRSTTENHRDGRVWLW
jgi:hypothetical protein